MELKMNSTTDMVHKNEESNIASSGNLSESPYGTMEALSFMHVLPTMYGILCITGVIANGLVLYAVATCQKKMVSDLYVLNLAIADMLFLLVMPFTIHQLVRDQQWVFGNFMCKAVTVVDVSNQFTTVGIVTVLCIDRYVAIVHPTSEKRTIRCTIVINVMVWVTSFLLTIPVMLYTHTKQEDVVEMCMMDLPRGPIDMYWYTLHQSTIGFIIPLVIISTFYSLALYHVFRSQRTVKRGQSVWTKRATKTVVMVIAIFLLCWSPYHVIQIINLNIHSPTSAFMLAYHISICLSYSHSCINPIMLLIFGQNYRKRIWRRKGVHAG